MWSCSVIAHRGACAYAPENTLPAFELGVAQGADAIELDAKLTKDGVVVVMHDPSVDRTTDGRGRVSDLAWADLKALDAGAKFDSRFAGTRIPTLSEVFEAVRGRVWINVELTNYTSPGDGLEAAVVALVRKMDLRPQVLFSSFSPFILHKAMRFSPEIPAALLYPSANPLLRSGVWLAPFMPHAACHPEAALVDERLVAWCHRRGKRVNAWTVNDPDEMRRLFRLGVDGLITDRPDVALKVRDA